MANVVVIATSASGRSKELFMSGTMKAVRIHQYGGVEKLVFEDAPIPAPGGGQVLVKVHAASVNPFDYKVASGAFAKFIPLTLPYVPGADFFRGGRGGGRGGRRRAARGCGVRQLPAGRRVCSIRRWPAATIALKPRTLSHAAAASVPTGSQTAWQGLFDHGWLERGQTVLIHAAAGGVGTFAVQLAHWKGAKVLATASAATATLSARWGRMK